VPGSVLSVKITGSCHGSGIKDSLFNLPMKTGLQFCRIASNQNRVSAAVLP